MRWRGGRGGGRVRRRWESEKKEEEIMRGRVCREKNERSVYFAKEKIYVP